MPVSEKFLLDELRAYPARYKLDFKIAKLLSAEHRSDILINISAHRLYEMLSLLNVP